jgi:hypothetical protein
MGARILETGHWQGKLRHQVARWPGQGLQHECGAELDPEPSLPSSWPHDSAVLKLTPLEDLAHELADPGLLGLPGALEVSPSDWGFSKAGLWGGVFLVKIHLVCPCCQPGLMLIEAEQLTTVHTRTTDSYLGVLRPDQGSKWVFVSLAQCFKIFLWVVSFSRHYSNDNMNIHKGIAQQNLPVWLAAMIFHEKCECV